MLARQVGGGVAGVRGAAPAAPLVEQDDAVARRVEVAAEAGGAAGPGPAVHDERGLAVGVAAGLPVDAVAVADVEHALRVRLDLRIQVAHAASLAIPRKSWARHPRLWESDSCRWKRRRSAPPQARPPPVRGWMVPCAWPCGARSPSTAARAPRTPRTPRTTGTSRSASRFRWTRRTWWQRSGCAPGSTPRSSRAAPAPASRDRPSTSRSSSTRAGT